MLLTEDERGNLPALLGGHVLHCVQRRQALLVNHVHVDTCWTTGHRVLEGGGSLQATGSDGAEGGVDLRREASAPRPSSRRERPRGEHCLSPSGTSDVTDTQSSDGHRHVNHTNNMEIRAEKVTSLNFFLK